MPDAWDRECEPARVAIEADRDPVAVLRAMAGRDAPFCLLGSWAGGPAIIGADPVAWIEGQDALSPPPLNCRSDTQVVVGGGWVGHLGYQLGAEIERLPPVPPRPRPLPLGRFALYDHVLRLDPDGQWWLEALWPEALERGLERVRAARAAASSRTAPWKLGPLRPAGAGAAGHRAAVAECVERIAAGELFQANLCLRLGGRFEGSSLEAFAVAAPRLRPAHGAFVSFAEGALLSFSPELFLRRSGRHVETAPIKGTVPRSADPESAAASRSRLRASGKDGAEHVMIVDLMRNDLGRVARYGTVTADAEPRVESHPGLWHLVSTVSAELRADVTDGELLRATFPPGSVTGAPKVQSLKVISELEGSAREAYTGAIGIISPLSGLELNVAIRTLEIRGADAWIGCGGGIVAESDPEREWQEALDKATPIAAALGTSIELGADTAPAQSGRRPLPALPALPRLQRRPDPSLGLYETLRMRAGVPVDLDLHLRRLADGLELGYGIGLPDGLREHVLAAAAAVEAPARLRVTVRPGREAVVEAGPAAVVPSSLMLRPVTVTGGLGDRKLADREPLLAFEGEGFAGLICDIDGGVLEATSANVWALLDGRLLTPPDDGRILPGVTRAALLTLGTIGGVPMIERPLTLDDLREADALLVTSSVRIAAPATLAPGPLVPGPLRSGPLPSGALAPGDLDAAVRLAATIRSVIDSGGPRIASRLDRDRARPPAFVSGRRDA